MGKYDFTRTTKNNIGYLDLTQSNMIGQFNLLDKVWYVKGNQISEVTIVSKTRDSYYSAEKVVKVVKIIHFQMLRFLNYFIHKKKHVNTCQIK